MARRFPICILAFLAIGCSRDKIKPDFDDNERKSKKKDGYLFGKELQVTFGGDDASSSNNSGDALWKGALNALSEYPLALQNFQVRIIQTDWIYIKKEEKRYKAIVRLKSEKVVEDDIDVQVIMESKSQKGEWVPAAADRNISEEIKKSIVAHAQRIAQPEKTTE